MLPANGESKTIQRASSDGIELLQYIANPDQDIEAFDENNNPK